MSVILASFWFAAIEAQAVPITLFTDVETYLERAKEIIIARCIEVPEDGGIAAVDGFYPVTVDVVANLKGNRDLVHLKIGTIYPMQQGKTYLMTNTGGEAFGSNFLSLGELTVVPISETLDLDSLKGKPLREQVELIFARNLYDLERELDPLLAKERMLRQALKDRRDDLFESKGPIRLPEIKELETKGVGASIFLEFPCGRLDWSHATPGRSGYFYFNPPAPRHPQWEFAAIDRDVEDLKALDGKPLKAKFYGLLSPSRDKRLGQAFGGAIKVEVGQLILARYTTDPTTIYFLQLVSQGPGESLRVKYAVLKAE
jgi:hypothetical protein